MKKLLLSATALAVLAAAPGLASAQGTNGWYGSANAGYSLDGGLDFENPTPLAGALDRAFVIGNSGEGDGGWGGGLALGYAFDNGFRLEGAIDNSHSNFSSSAALASLGGTQVWTAMLNGLYDFNRDGMINPFLGAGVGMGRVKTNFDSVGAATNLATTSRVRGVDTDSALAWQLIAGLGIRLSDQLSADLTYRMLNISDLSFAGTATGGSTASASRLVNGAYGGNGLDGGTVGLGLRYAFAAPVVVSPPPPPPPPPPNAPNRLLGVELV